MFLSSIPVETGSHPTRIWPGKRWARNPYRVHQRLCMAFDGQPDGRVLFRIEGPVRTSRGLRPRILVQSIHAPDWDQAFRNAPITVVQPVTFLQLVWAAIMDVLLFDVGIDPYVIAGGAVIVFSATYIAHREHRAARRLEDPPVPVDL